jgi:hypothetical protein
MVSSWDSCARLATQLAACALDFPTPLAVEEQIWFNDSTDATALAEEVAHHIARSASGRVDLEATITISDGG